MQRHAIGEGLKIRSWTRRCFCFKGKTMEMYWSNCGGGTPHLAYALRNTAAVTGLRKLQSSYVFSPGIFIGTLKCGDGRADGRNLSLSLSVSSFPTCTLKFLSHTVWWYKCIFSVQTSKFKPFCSFEIYLTIFFSF